MRVQEVMTAAPVTCQLGDSARTAAQIMWDHDCGIVPVEDLNARVIGVVTDRDICMAALLQSLPLDQIQVESCMTHGLYACRPDDDVAKAERLMSERQVHRIPIVDNSGYLVGIVSVGDIARQFARHGATDTVNYLAEEFVQTMAAIAKHRQYA